MGLMVPWGKSFPYRSSHLVLIFLKIVMRCPLRTPKGLVINYREGGATKWENRGSETFCAPPPPKTG